MPLLVWSSLWATETHAEIAPTITSPFGWRVLDGRREWHDGVDLAAPRGTSVCALHAGMVLEVGSNPRHGHYVIVGSGALTTLYAHLDKSIRSAGEFLASAEPIGFVGSSGRSTGPHLHLEQRSNGIAFPPRNVEQSLCRRRNGN